MDDIILVHVANPLQSLTKKSKGFRFSEGSFGILMVEEISVLSIVHNHVNAIVFEKSVPQLDNVRMVDSAMNGNLPLKKFDLGLGRDILDRDLNNINATILTANIRVVIRCLASLTTPKEPQPTCLSGMNWNSFMLLNRCLDWIAIIEKYRKIMFKLIFFLQIYQFHLFPFCQGTIPKNIF